jgi:bisphosphoglycerate-dependent phosphoglycerate mutase
MKNILCLTFILVFAFSSVAEAGKEKIKLDSVETANCAAAAMKSQGAGIFGKWFAVLEQKYTSIYPKKNKEEVQAYTTERVLDKRRSLQSKGYDSKPAFNKYYQMNCVDFEPK